MRLEDRIEKPLLQGNPFLALQVFERLGGVCAKQFPKSCSVDFPQLVRYAFRDLLDTEKESYLLADPFPSTILQSQRHVLYEVASDSFSEELPAYFLSCLRRQFPVFGKDTYDEGHIRFIFDVGMRHRVHDGMIIREFSGFDEYVGLLWLHEQQKLLSRYRPLFDDENLAREVDLLTESYVTDLYA